MVMEVDIMGFMVGKERTRRECKPVREKNRRGEVVIYVIICSVR